MPVPSSIDSRARKVRLADAGRAEQQRGRDLERVAAVLAQRELALHVVEHLGEVGHLVVQVLHHWQAGGLDLEAFGTLFEHALVGGAQGLVLLRRQFGQATLDVVAAVDRAHGGDRDVAPAVHRYQIVGALHASLQVT